MASVRDEMVTIEAIQNYVANSLIIKSYDDRGVVLKWLESNGLGTADRKQKFLSINEAEKQTVLLIEDRTVLSSIMVSEAQ